MTTQPEALRLADDIEKGHSELTLVAVDALRYQHRRIAELEEALRVALEALENDVYPMMSKKHCENYDNAITKIKEVL